MVVVVVVGGTGMLVGVGRRWVRACVRACVCVGVGGWGQIRPGRQYGQIVAICF